MDLLRKYSVTLIQTNPINWISSPKISRSNKFDKNIIGFIALDPYIYVIAKQLFMLFLLAKVIQIFFL